MNAQRQSCKTSKSHQVASKLQYKVTLEVTQLWYCSSVNQALQQCHIGGTGIKWKYDNRNMGAAIGGSNAVILIWCLLPCELLIWNKFTGQVFRISKLSFATYLLKVIEDLEPAPATAPILLFSQIHLFVAKLSVMEVTSNHRSYFLLPWLTHIHII